MMWDLLDSIGDFFKSIFYCFLFILFCLCAAVCLFFVYLRHLLISKKTVANVIKSYKQERYSNYYDDCIYLTVKTKEGKLIKFTITDHSLYRKVFFYLRDNDISFDKKYKIRYFYFNNRPRLMSCRSL